MVSTIEEKILDMLSTVREMREKIRKIAKKEPHQLADRIVGLFDRNKRMSQQELCQSFPEMSGRTIRRHIQQLIDQGVLVSEKIGREATYRKAEDLSTNPHVDERKRIW